MIETGNVLEMKPSNGSQMVEQINEKLALFPLWPWPVIAGIGLALYAFSQPNGQPFGIAVSLVAILLTAFLVHYDRQRKTVVIMYDLDETVLPAFQRVTEEFDKLAKAAKIWNVDSAERTTDWKRNAGAGQLLTRKPAYLSYNLPGVIKTNLPVPAITGGRQNIYFFPDVVLIQEGARVGALSYDQLEVVWTDTVFIENETVPSDAQIVGQTWRFVNKNGGPDRRFNNNRQIPKVRYLQMGLWSSQGLRKILHLSRMMDHASFDSALASLRGTVNKAKLLGAPTELQSQEAAAPSKSQPALSDQTNRFVISDRARKLESEKPSFWEYNLTVELLRANVAPLVERWSRVRTMPKHTFGSVEKSEAVNWCSEKIDGLQPLYNSFNTLVNEDLRTAWGPPGQPGDAQKIEKTCADLTDCAKRSLDWEEAMRFTRLPEGFSELQNALLGSAAITLEHIARLYEEMARVFEQEKPSGTHNIQLVLKYPEGWEERVNQGIRHAAEWLQRTAP